MIADVRRFLLALTPHMRTVARGPAAATRWGTFIAPTNQPVRPQILMQTIQRLVVEDTDALVFAEPGNSFAWANHLLRFASPSYRLSGYWASMGHMVTGAVGAALETKRACVVITGDGSMLMQSEVSTAVQYQAPVVWLVLNDARYGMTEEGMRAQGFTPPETSIPRVDFAALARAMGADGVNVGDERELAAAIKQGLAAKGPFVIDVEIDVNERAPFLARVKALAAMGAP